MTAGTALPYRQVECGCGQLIAKCWPGGDVRIVVISDYRIDPNGKYRVTCPRCEHVVKFRPIRGQVLE